jgi:hypothetical protein
MTAAAAADSGPPVTKKLRKISGFEFDRISSVIPAEHS